MTDTYYPHVRAVLEPQCSGLTDSELDAVFESAFGEGASAAEYEEFFGGLGRALGGLAQRAAPALGSSAQGALSGAAAGSALGPWGALGGALIGGVGSALAQHGRGPARDVGRVIGTFTGGGAMPAPLAPAAPVAPGPPMVPAPPGPAAPATPPTPGAPAPAAPPPTSAISWLGQLLASPAAAQAIAALMQGRGGTVPVGATATPVQASEVVGLMGALARESEAEAIQWDVGQGPPAYLIGPEGELESDPYDVDLRAVRLLELFASEAEWDEELDSEDLYELDESESEFGFGEDLELYDAGVRDSVEAWSA